MGRRELAPCQRRAAGARRYRSAVITRMSELFVRTLRDDPADAEVPSHRWLVRAGYIRRAAPGIYSWLPLGWRVLRNVERIVREEMDAIGAQEVHFPALLPQGAVRGHAAAGPSTAPNIFRLKDRKGADYLLGPTHEEMFTLLVKDLYSSYKDLPLSLYQIQTKYRDEARPRAGHPARPRVRDEGLLLLRHRRRRAAEVLRPAPRRLHQDLQPARLRVRDRARHVGRDGRLGQRGVPGRGRERRGHLRPLAGRLRGQRRGGADPPPGSDRRTTTPRRRTSRTPRTPRPSTTLVAMANAAVPARRPGLDRRRHAEERRADGHRARRHPGAAGRRAARATARWTSSGWPRSWSRPRSSRSATTTSPRTRSWSRATSGRPALGADVASAHPLPGRPAGGPAPAGSPARTQPAGTSSTWSAAATSHPTGRIEAAEIREGDPAPDGSGPLRLARGIEMGHIFQLGRKYAEALGLKVLDRERQARHGDHGLLRGRGLARRRRGRGGHLRREGSVLAAGAGAVRRAPGGHRQGRGGAAGRRRAGRRSSTRPGSRCCSTIARPARGSSSPTPRSSGCRPSSWSAAVWPTGRSRSGTARTGERTDVDVAEAAGRIVASCTASSDLD